METFSNCKELWASLSATGVVLDEDKVGQLLENHKHQLLSGVLCFKKSKTDKPAKAPAGEAKTIKILVELISDTIGVDVDVSRQMLDQYLMYQFRGEGKAIEWYLTDSSLKSGLLADIWTSVLRESVFLLHCSKLVLSSPKSHPYYATFSAFVESLDLKELQEKIVAQLEALKDEQPPTISSLDDEWHAAVLARRLLLCQTLLFIHQPSPAKIILKLLNLFKEQTFVKQIATEKHKTLANLLCSIQSSLLVHLIMQLPKIDNSELVKEKNLLTQLKEVIFSLDCKTGGLLKLAYNAAFYTGAEEEAMTLVVSAFEENQFESIYNILVAVNCAGDTEVTSKVSGVFFGLLELLVERYYVKGFSSFPMFFRACGMVLSQPESCLTFWEQEDCSMRALLKLSLDYFPHLLPPILHLLRASAKAGQLEKMLEVISEMDLFTEEKSKNTRSFNVGQENDVSLTEDIYIMDKMLIMNAGTQGVLSNQNTTRPLVHWNVRYNFWDALYNQLTKLNAELRRTQTCDLEKAVLILKSIHYVLKAGYVTDKITNAVQESFLLVEIACQMSNPPAEVLAEGLKILVDLLDSHKARVCEMAAKTRLVPCWLGPGPPSLLGQVEYGVWQHTLLGVHITSSTSALVRAYLRFLLQVAQGDSDEGACESVLAAGLLVVSQNIFPGHTEWMYPRPRDEETIGVLCLQFLQALLIKGKRWEVLVVECLLKTKASFTLMQLAASGEDHIESIMVKEPSFLAARTTRLLLKIRLSLSLLNQALQRKHLVLEKGSRECALLQQLSSSHQVEVENFYFRLSLYLQSRLHPYLPTLAVKVLQHIFEVLPVSLRFYLRMEDSLIRSTLEMHLLAHDSYPPLRAAILDLLTNCVKTHTQSALLVLMFTQQSQQKEVQALPAEGAKSDTLDFILSSLVEASEDEDTMDSPVYKSAVDFCQACWSAPVLYILKSFVNSDDFWTTLTTPLFTHKISTNEPYIQLMRILFIEIVRPKFPAEDLDQVLKKFVAERIIPWNKFILDQLKEGNDKKDTIAEELARAWSNLLVALIKKRRALLDEKSIADLTLSYLDYVLCELKESTESPNVTLTTQVLLHLLNAAASCKDIGEDFSDKMVKLAELISRRYTYLQPATRTTLLSILAKSLTCSSFDIQQALRGGFESHISEIICKESLEGRRLGLHRAGETMAYILALRLLQVAGDKMSSFGSELTFSCLTKDAIHKMREKNSAVCPEIILKTLVAAASNPHLAPSIGIANLKSIWMALLDLKLDTVRLSGGMELSFIELASSPEKLHWDLVYEQGVHFANALALSGWQHCQAEVASYLIEHRPHLIVLLTALKASQDRRTLLLATETVRLLGALSPTLWNNHNVLHDYAGGVLACLDLCLIFIARPKLVLDRYAKPQLEPAEPFQYTNEKSNLLMSLAEGCMQCLLGICQPSGQLSRRTLLSDWRQCRLVLLDSFSVHHCYDPLLSPSIAFGNLLHFAFSCPLFVHHRETYPQSNWLNEPKIALADEKVTLKALKRCIDLLLQQARVLVLRQPDCIPFRNSLRTEMDALFEAIRVKVFKHEDRHLHIERKFKEIEYSNCPSLDKSHLERTPLTPISTDSRIVSR